LIIANAETHEPIDILPNRRKDTIKDYLYQYEGTEKLTFCNRQVKLNSFCSFEMNTFA